MQFFWRAATIGSLLAATTLFLYAEFVALSTVSFSSNHNVGPLILGLAGLYYMFAYAFDVTMLVSLSQIPPGRENRAVRIAVLIVGIFCYGYAVRLLFSLA